MNTLLSSPVARFSKRLYHLVLVTALLAIILVGSAFSLAPAAHASGLNTCDPHQPDNCVKIWATQVNVHDQSSGTCILDPHRSCRVIDSLAGGGEKVYAYCQQPGQTITYGSFTSKWWMLLIGDNGNTGWTSNVFIVGGAHISDVPDCNF